jgi:hypothetical protein
MNEHINWIINGLVKRLNQYKLVQDNEEQMAKIH